MSPYIGCSGKRAWIAATGLLLLCAAAGFSQDVGPATVVEPSPELESRIAQWITELGDGEYSVREKAQEELRRLGTTAFDHLLAAQDYADKEIAQRARYLVRSIPVAWTLDSDPAEVKGLLVNFGTLTRSERATRTQHLATLEKGAGIEALCRIVRFEPDRVLSKQAALLVLSRPVSEDEVQRRALAQSVRRGVSHSKRPAVEWLLAYCRELDEPNRTLAEWERITRAELATFAKTPQLSDRVVVRDLLRFQTKLLLNRGREADSLANFRRTYDLINDDVSDIYEAIDWSIENKLFTAPDEIASRYADRIRGESRLLYRLAEAQLKRGNSADAEKTALEARNLKPTKFGDHLAMAMLLYQRGLIDWSANEYRLVLDNVKVESDESVEARDGLSRMLVDLGRELEAADAIKPLVEFAEKEEKTNEITQAVNTYFRGNMHFWYATHFARLGDRAKQIEHLTKAIDAYPSNIDIQIAMYRLPDADANWKQDVQKRIDEHLRKCRTLIEKFEEVIRRQPNFEGAASNDLATAYNEMAWLISNTAGDFQEAVRASQRSLELYPENEAYLDTLARCFFAAGDLENAVKYQRRAVAAAPHLQVMKRQLIVFEQALADSRAKR